MSLAAFLQAGNAADLAAVIALQDADIADPLERHRQPPRAIGLAIPALRP
eukprot:gene45062-61042_t